MNVFHQHIGRLIRAVTLVTLSVTLSVTLPQCKVTYSFSGVNISPEVLSYSVDYFPNRAPIVQAQLSQLFTDALMDKIQANTSLDLSTDGGDVHFSGEITNYETRPTAITGQETAARNRLTIAVRVKYANLLEPDLDYDAKFSRFEDYDATQNLSDVENELIELIVENLIEDIFNRAFVSW
ncbi:MAG: LptE family protein [Bacteroidales bacterium]|nr:LptE family protein [Bacteroidales bacterium]